MSRVSVLSRLHNAVGNLATYIWLRQSFVAILFERCRYFLPHVTCQNLPWQGLIPDAHADSTHGVGGGGRETMTPLNTEG